MPGVEPIAAGLAAARPPQRILFLIYGLQPAGPELRLLEFARHFPDAIDVHICVIGDDLTLLQEFAKTRAKISHVPIRRAYAEWGQVGKILAYIGEQDIAIVNSFDLKTLLVALAAKVRFGRRLRLVHHLISLWDGLRDHHKTLLWNALRYPDVIICNGHAVKAGLIGSRRMRGEVLVIPNGVDCRHFAPDAELRRAERDRLGIAPNEFVLGTVANIRPVKNFPFLLRGMRRLADRYPEARLVCVGGGPQLEEMRALAHSLGVGDAVLFAGQTQDVRPWLATFDAFALCSFKEGCPNALMQAMAMEVASMSSDVGEVSHLTDGGTCGLLFQPTDGDTFFQHAARIMEDELYRVRLAQAGRRRMEEHYDGAKMIDAYVTMFAALAGRTDTRSAA